MNKQKLYNKEIRYLRKKFPHSEIKKMKFSYGLIDELFDKYHLKEYSESFYDDIREDRLTWVEVEGEQYGWVWSGVKNSKRRQKLREYVSNILRSNKMRPHLINRNIYMIEYKDFVFISIPLLDVKAYNIGLVFVKDPNRLGLFG